MNSCLDRYFYSIETDADGERFIHLFGNIYLNDVDDTEKNFRIAEWTFFYIDIRSAQEMFKEDIFYEYVNERVDYLLDVTETEALDACENYFNGHPGSQLHIYDIAEDTPCGDYWF